MIFINAVNRYFQAAAALLSLLLLSGFSLANTTPTIPTVSLGERITCQTAIEEVYWRHRQWPQENVE